MVTHTPLPVAVPRTSSAKGVVLTKVNYHAAEAGRMQYGGVKNERFPPTWKSGGGGLWLDSAAQFWRAGVDD